MALRSVTGEGVQNFPIFQYFVYNPARFELSKFEFLKSRFGVVVLTDFFTESNKWKG